MEQYTVLNINCIPGVSNLQSTKLNIYTKNNKAQKQIIMLQIKKVWKYWQILTPKDVQTG